MQGNVKADLLELKLESYAWVQRASGCTCSAGKESWLCGEWFIEAQQEGRVYRIILKVQFYQVLSCQGCQIAISPSRQKSLLSGFLYSHFTLPIQFLYFSRFPSLIGDKEFHLHFLVGKLPKLVSASISPFQKRSARKEVNDPFCNCIIPDEWHLQ